MPFDSLPPRGAACSNSRPLPSPPPQTPQSFRSSSFSKLRIWWKVLAPKAPKFFFWSPEGVLFFFTLCFYTQNTQNFVGEKHTQKFDTQPDLQVGPWLMDA